MAHLEITAIRLSPGGSRLEHITDIFGPAFGQMTREQAIREIDSGVSTFYVRRGLLGQVQVESVHPTNALMSLAIHRPYLRTVPDDILADNLLRLPRQ